MSLISYDEMNQAFKHEVEEITRSKVIDLHARYYVAIYVDQAIKDYRAQQTMLVIYDRYATDQAVVQDGQDNGRLFLRRDGRLSSDFYLKNICVISGAADVTVNGCRDAIVQAIELNSHPDGKDYGDGKLSYEFEYIPCTAADLAIFRNADVFYLPL